MCLLFFSMFWKVIFSARLRCESFHAVEPMLNILQYCLNRGDAAVAYDSNAASLNQAYSLGLVDMVDYSAAKCYADVSRFPRVLSGHAAMLSRPRCA